MLSDEIPCSGHGPIFSRARGGELWVALLEKAWAKVFGTYQHTIGGSPGDCMANLTGAPFKYVPCTKTDLWQQMYNATSNEQGVRKATHCASYSKSIAVALAWP